MPRGGGGDEVSSPRPASSAASTVVAFPSKTEDVEASVVLVTTANDGDAMVVAVVGNGVVVVGGIFVVIAVDTGSAVIRESPVGFVATVAPTASRSASLSLTIQCLNCLQLSPPLQKVLMNSALLRRLKRVTHLDNALRSMAVILFSKQ